MIGSEDVFAWAVARIGYGWVKNLDLQGQSVAYTSYEQYALLVPTSRDAGRLARIVRAIDPEAVVYVDPFCWVYEMEVQP